jgi:hypothetical protein
MNQGPLDRYGSRVRNVAMGLAYPPTPEIRWYRPASAAAGLATPRSLNRRLAWAMIVVVVALASLLAVPEARAAVVRWIRIGAVRIFLTGPGRETRPAPVTASPAEGTFPSAGTSTPTPSVASAEVFDRLAGETTLDEAMGRSAFKILLPDYPPDLGPPDRVFFQDQGGSVVFLVWMSPGDHAKARLVLQELASESWGNKKVQVEAVQTATVAGQPAVWAIGPYMLFYRNGDLVEQRLVEGHVLIWENGGVTYRLESDLSIDEAVRVAESLE